MALTAVQQNLATEMQTCAEEILALKGRIDAIMAMHASEAMTTISDADLQALTPFAHMTVVELTAARNAFAAIQTALGGYVAGEQAYRLMKIVGRVPK